jgi:site-specific DNA-methyltransferase (adenine-specific)
VFELNQFQCVDAFDCAKQFDDGSVDLLLTDPPYFGIVDEKWDNQWKDDVSFCDFFVNFLRAWRSKLKPNASVIFFGAIGRPGNRGLLRIILAIDNDRELNLHFRNWLTWKKRRAYGKSHDYLWIREEFLWYSASPARTDVKFNIPLTNEKRGYAGYNKKYPAKSDYKRVGNVWADIPELMRTARPAEKPVALLERIIATHSNENDLVVDPFCGTGNVAVACKNLKRNFFVSDLDSNVESLVKEKIK